MRRLLSRDRRVELAAFTFVMAVALAVRVVKLGTIPRIVTADETDNLQTAYHIIKGTGDGIIGFDWKPGPIFSLYPLAWTIRVFGDSVADFRIFSVALSMLTLLAFYALAREKLRFEAALGALLLLATNLWFLNFSRTAWDNMNAPLFAVGACFATTRALRATGGSRDWAAWWVLTGVFVALGLYGYFTGRFIFVSAVLIGAIAALLRQSSWRWALAGLGIAGVVAGALFAPMAAKIAHDWDYFNRRTTSISVFSEQGQAREGETNGWYIAAKNVVRNVRAFVLQDGSQMQRSPVWGRYGPSHRAPLDIATALLFWGGLIVAAIRWRTTYAWWTLFAPLFLAEVFSVGTPDLARGLIFAPFYFLFIGLFLDEVFRLATRRRVLFIATFAMAAFVAVAAVSNVVEYFRWQSHTSTQLARMPGVDVCEFDLWRGLALASASRGRANLSPTQFDQLRRKLDCSSIVRTYLPKEFPSTSP